MKNLSWFNTENGMIKRRCLLLKGGCITKLENFILEHLKIIGAVGIGIACVQVS